MTQKPAAWNLISTVGIVKGAAHRSGHATLKLLHERGARISAGDRAERVHAVAAEDKATLKGDAAKETTDGSWTAE